MLDWLEDANLKASSSPLHLRGTRSFLILTLKTGLRSEHEPELVPEKRLLRKNYLAFSKKCQSRVLSPEYPSWSQFWMRSSLFRVLQLLCINRWDWLLLAFPQFLKRRPKSKHLGQVCLHFWTVPFAFSNQNFGYLLHSLHSFSDQWAEQGAAPLSNLARPRPLSSMRGLNTI